MKLVAANRAFFSRILKKRKSFTKICSTFEIGAVQRIVNLVVLEQMLQKAYLGGKIGFDAGENEPSKICSSNIG